MKMIPVFLVFLMLSCSGREQLVRPVSKPIKEAVYASGYLVAADEYEVVPQVEGTVVEKLVEDGSIVKKGEAIYILESGQQSSRFDLARKTYNQAVANAEAGSPLLAEVAAGLAAAKSKKTFDSVNFVRYSNLWEKNATTRAEYDRSRLALENSGSDFRQWLSRYNKLRNQLLLEVESARSALTVAGNESGKYIIRSEVDGRVFRMTKERGELVRRTDVVAVIGKDDDWRIELSVDELDVSRVKEGQRVLVAIDAYPGHVYHATVFKLYPWVNRQQQSVRVDAVLSENLPAAFSGLSVEGNIIIQTKPSALVVPVAALHGADSLIVRTKDGEEKIRVEIGVRSMDEVEVTGGITADTEILIQN